MRSTSVLFIRLSGGGNPRRPVALGSAPSRLAPGREDRHAVGLDICTTLSFQISYDGAAYLDLFHVAQTAAGPWTSYEATISPVVANSMLLLPAGAGLNVPFLKIRSGTRLRPISQGADRSFTIVFGD